MTPKHVSLAAFLSILLLVSSVAALAAVPGASFEGADGDLVSGSQPDWETFVGTPELRIGYDAPTGQDDDSLRGKEDDPAPATDTGSIPNNKSDLLRFYVVHDPREVAGEVRDFLYLAWTRANTLGTANMDFEFNQAATLTSNETTPVRTAGDMLITFAFANGGNTVELGLSRWTTTGPCEASNAGPCWGPIMPLSGIAEGAVNAAAVLDPLTGAVLPELTFGEAVVDLTGAGVFDRDTCTSFGGAYVKSRSSDSFTSSMKDFIRPIDVRVSNCATVRIVKDAVPAGPTAFPFQASPEMGGPAAFDLADDGTGTNDRMTFEGTFSGPVTIAEQATAGWDLTSLTCDGAAVVERVDGMPTGRVDLDLMPGDDVECVFTNVARGRIVVDEVTIPGGDPQAFGYGLAGPGGPLASFDLTDAAPAFESGLLAAGTYAVSTAPLPPGWDLTGVVCDDGSAPDAVMLEPGETVTCTFTHTRRGRIVVDKITAPAGDPAAFSFALTGGPDAIDAGFSLTDAAPAHDSGWLRPGAYAVSEGDAGPDWDLTAASCSGGDDPAAIDLAPGEIVTCSFTNTRRGRIVVDKITSPAADPGVFSFALTGGPESVDDGFTLTDAADPRSSGPLRPGVYAVIEADPGAAWDLTGVVCSDGSDPAAIAVAPGETVTCTFTNTRRGRIVIDKITLPAGDPTVFEFTLSGGPDAVATDVTLADQDPASTSAWLRPGAYAVVEADAGDAWDPTGASCSDGSDPAAIDLGPGETVTCSFTNTRRGRIRIDKVTLPAADPTSFSFSLSGGPDGTDTAFALADASDPWTSAFLRPGSYVAIEADAGIEWDVTAASCSDGGDPSAIDLAPGETVTCTFTNTKRGHLVIDKVTLPVGDPASFSFSVSGGPSAVAATFALSDVDAPHDVGALVPGVYAVSEGDAGAEWDLTDATCSDGSDPAAVDVAPGETVTCTFTNTKRGHIVVDKVTLPAGSARAFAFAIGGGPDDVGLAFELADEDDPYATVPLRAGSYAVVEGPAGEAWDLAGAACSDGSAPGAVDLAPGETVTCVFTNVERARLTVIKNALPAGGELFDFTAVGDGGEHAFALADGGAESGHLMLVPHGTWRVAEADAGEAWELTGISCSDGAGQSRGSLDLAAGAATLALAPGDDVTCTFHNRKRGRIVVRKEVVNESLTGVGFDPRTNPFEFEATFTGLFQLAHGDSRTSEWLEPERTYSITERLPRGWIVESRCVLPDGGVIGGGAAISFPLAPGAEVECSFVNEMRIHPGTHGFWRNWRNQYVESELLWVIAGLADSPILSPWFEDGEAMADVVAQLDRLYEEAEHPPAFRAVREYVTLLLNISVSTSEDPAVRALQKNDDVCESCLLDLSDRPGAEALIRALAPCVREDVTIGDVLTATELAWTGDLSVPEESFDDLTAAEVGLLHSILDDINNGRNVTVDPESYPDDPGCLEHPDGPTVWRTIFRDADGDGHGDAADSAVECSLDAVAGWSDLADDCDDGDGDSHPGGVEVCDLADNDCDGIVDAETDGDNDGVDDVCDAFPADAGMSGPLHVGLLEGVDDVWRTVALPRVYQDPVVILGPASSHDAERGGTRIDRVTGTAFDVRFEEWAYLDGVHGEESVPYLVIERGRHTMADGSIWEAGTFPIAGTGVGVGAGFEATFPGDPTLLLTVQTAADPVPVTIVARDVNRNGFDGVLMEEGWLMRNRDPQRLPAAQSSGGGGELAAVAVGDPADESAAARQHGEEIAGYLAIHSWNLSGRVAGAEGPLAFLRQGITLDERGAPVAGFKLLLENDGSTAGATPSETVHVLALPGVVFAQSVASSGEATTALRRLDPLPDDAIEWGTVAGVRRNWTIVPLAGRFVDPVVVVKSTSMNGSVPVVARTRLVGPDSFEVTLRDWKYLEPVQTEERVFYVVVERGRHEIAGLDVEAGTFVSYARFGQELWHDVEFEATFSGPPAVFTSAQTFHGPDPLVTRAHERTAAGFRSMFQEEEGGDGGHVAETVGWIAIEPGTASASNGRVFGVSVEALDHVLRTFEFAPLPTRFATVVADLASTIELDPCSVRHTRVDGRSVDLFVEEEQSLDDEMEHVLEELSLFVAD